AHCYFRAGLHTSPVSQPNLPDTAQFEWRNKSQVSVACPVIGVTDRHRYCRHFERQPDLPCRGGMPLALARAARCGALENDVAASPTFIRVGDRQAVGLVEQYASDRAAELLWRIGRGGLCSRRSLEEVSKRKLVRRRIVGERRIRAARAHF